MYKNILIATDGSELAEVAVRHGLSLAKSLGAKATIITVTPPWKSIVTGEAMLSFPAEDYDKSVALEASEILTQAGKLVEEIGADCETIYLANQHPAEGIVATAEERGADVIVMASHGRRGLARLLLGSQANQVVGLSSIPVLICKSPNEEQRLAP